MPRSGSSGETDADADTDENFSASLKIPTMIVETTTLASLAPQHNHPQEGPHQTIFMMLKGKGHDDDRRYKRLGLVIQEIVAKRMADGKKEYEVRWLGYPDTTCEPEASLRLKVPRMLQDFLARQ
ncbi:hypothetical protein TrVFT333_002171 [Trichoderma virens FT-333]|nr:hypothetical protein TrVFT333_002171 [Trichoderma virens FT-333]